jgi:hypothetical protein
LCDDKATSSHDACHAAKDGKRIDDVDQEESTKSEVDLLGKEKIFAGLGDRDDLGLATLGGRRRHFVASSRVAVDGVDPAASADELAEGDRDVTGTGTDVDATPPRTKAEAIERGLQRTPIDVVSQSELGHEKNATQSSPPSERSLTDRLSRASTVGAVRATMLLADAAQVADGKLYILGGGWSLIGPDPVPTAIALKIDVDWNEVDRPHHWELFLVDEDGRPALADTPDGPQAIEVRGDFEVSRPEAVPPGSPVDVALAVNFGPLPLAAATRYSWRLVIDGDAREDWVLPFSTRPAAEV